MRSKVNVLSQENTNLTVEVGEPVEEREQRVSDKQILSAVSGACTSQP